MTYRLRRASMPQSYLDYWANLNANLWTNWVVKSTCILGRGSSKWFLQLTWLIIMKRFPRWSKFFFIIINLGIKMKWCSGWRTIKSQRVKITISKSLRTSRSLWIFWFIQLTFLSSVGPLRWLKIGLIFFFTSFLTKEILRSNKTFHCLCFVIAIARTSQKLNLVSSTT